MEALYRERTGLYQRVRCLQLPHLQGQPVDHTRFGRVAREFTRNVAMELADRFEVVMRPNEFSEIASADEAFITSTTKEVMQLCRWAM